MERLFPWHLTGRFNNALQAHWYASKIVFWHALYMAVYAFAITCGALLAWRWLR